MDLRLFALLFLCFCKQGWMQEDPTAAEDGKIYAVPLIPLIPSKPRSDLESADVSHTAELTASTPTSENGENSSEEDLDGPCGKPRSSPEIRQAIGSGIMKFGLQLLENLNANSEQPNVIISPLSVSLALSQLALGARNETQDLLFQRLHADTVPCYHKALKSLLHHVRKNTLRIASRIYLRSGFQPKKEFMQESLNVYDSEPAPLTELEEINAWVEKATDGHVTDFLSSLPSNLVMMLINAVHYKDPTCLTPTFGSPSSPGFGEWLKRFDPRFTTSEPFYIGENLAVNVDMMLGPKYPLSMFTHNELEAQVARFPFKGNMSLVIVMPVSGHVNVTAIASKLNISNLYSYFPRERNMQVKLPKFKLDFTQELDEVLVSMGLGELFTNPNLAGISEGPLVVSSVQHKSSMEINEEGAEAAAATSVVISRSNPSFTVNQPFFFALIDDSSQTPLFLGVISNPNPKESAMISNTSDSDKPSSFDDKDDAPSFVHPPK